MLLSNNKCTPESGFWESCAIIAVLDYDGRLWEGEVFTITYGDELLDVVNTRESTAINLDNELVAVSTSRIKITMLFDDGNRKYLVTKPLEFWQAVYQAEAYDVQSNRL